MKKINVYILFSLIFFVFVFPQTTYSIDKVKTIVVFFSLDVNLPVYHGFLNGLNEQFSETPDQPYNLIVEYMDLSRFSDVGYINNIIGLYNKKYEAVEINMANKVKKSEGPSCAYGKGDLYEEWTKLNENNKAKVSYSIISNQVNDDNILVDDVRKEDQKRVKTNN